MTPEISIKANNISKTYKLYSCPSDRVKESFHPLRRKYHNLFYALRDVSFEIGTGETIGIVGKNGSGKSTLLKILTGVLTPTTGSVQVNGKISALLELGAGFNPELSGLENIFFNGMLMGFQQQEIEEKLDAILEFADIGNFVHQPVKIYSSGMFVRLAFAVAINVDPDILMVDEALAVGDIRFQRKCYSKFEEFIDKKKIILFVSHSLDTINMLCTKAMLLNEGALLMMGAPKKVTRLFQELMLGDDIVRDTISEGDSGLKNYPYSRTSTIECMQFEKDDKELIAVVNKKLANWNGTKKAEIVDAGIMDKKGEKVTQLQTGAEYTFFSRALIYEKLDKLHFGFPIRDKRGILLFGVNSDIQKINGGSHDPGDLLECVATIKMWLAPGDYFLSFGLGTVETNYDLLEDFIHFSVIGDCLQNPASLVNLQPILQIYRAT